MIFFLIKSNLLLCIVFFYTKEGKKNLCFYNQPKNKNLK